MSKTTIDHDEIRKWAESHGGKPAAVDRTHEGGDVGIIRIMFPRNKQSEHSSLVEISWDEFFDQFEESELALIYDDKSLFNKIVGRDTAERRAEGENDASRHKERKAHGDGATSAGKSSGSKSSGSKSSSERSSAAKSSREGDDLKSREYRDADGNVHHHTRSYMDEHRGGKD
jgi:hypothetical protein